MEFKDYYRLLGVARDAGADEIKRAFRRQARKLHPDVNPAPDAQARMQALNEAHAVLSDPERRAAYDALGRGHHTGERFTPPPGWDAGFEFSDRGGAPGGFSDFFSKFFSHMGGTVRRGDGARGEDHHARIRLALADAWQGAEREIALRVPQFDAQGRMAFVDRVLKVRIPRGIRAGQQIRLAGQGGAGTRGAGDLLLEVEFEPHPQWRLDGRDLAGELAVAPWEAALGAVVPVTLPDGHRLQVRVPAGTQSGATLRVPGQGLPGEPPGDLELAVRVLVPPADTARARALYEQMAREMPFDARKAA